MTAERSVILTFAGHYFPAFKAGGPIRTLVNMVDRLSDRFEFRIVAADRDLGDPEPFPGRPANVWTRVGHAEVFYRSPGLASGLRLLRSLETRPPDLIYLNSFFSPTASIYPLVSRRLGCFGRIPAILAPRGEFAIEAIAMKRAKKLGYLAVAQAIGLHKGVVFQASSEYEAVDIRRVLGKRRVIVASDIPTRSQDRDQPPRPGPRAPFRCVFLSRISPMKNLLGALQILRGIGVPVDFDIYGILEDAAYWARCEAAIASLPQNVRVRFLGTVQPDQVEATLSEYDAFLLPTLGENYGHVIREALSAGLPVLISDRTPWRGLEAKGAGADLPLDDLDLFADRIRAWASLPRDRYQAMREAARALGDDPVTAEAAAEANRRMFISTLRGSG